MLFARREKGGIAYALQHASADIRGELIHRSRFLLGTVANEALQAEDFLRRYNELDEKAYEEDCEALLVGCQDSKLLTTFFQHLKEKGQTDEQIQRTYFGEYQSERRYRGIRTLIRKGTLPELLPQETPAA